MKLPSGKVVTRNTPIYIGSNFTWGEATKDCTRPVQDLIINGKLIISSNAVEQNIVATAKELDIYRSLLGNRPIKVNSWYRPSHVNTWVGGSKYSRHQYGDAVDIRSDYFSAFQIHKILDRLHLEGGLGRYYSFVHIDFRGQVARWFG
ncbi:hypothetical protein I4641_23380 [Waterburya agarophytonicola K14]|uniref:Peptidase M15A C-terminal domain-containing protein n=1 Tax=Waterburya agarophytonicola KI4 TaxID=2874699 RepID=A0A964BUG9_9CYAN|nr:D-Ala-D-Ala carboxypeptidase family metallohydrolase [Waterburya agarophytonicola]MCC0179883.1 hypothetical protein [Waterburya agarophytonicola KI4]